MKIQGTEKNRSYVDILALDLLLTGYHIISELDVKGCWKIEFMPGTLLELLYLTARYV